MREGYIYLKEPTAKILLSYTQLNRPKQLNSFGGSLVEDTIAALRELDNHPDTTFTVITGEGRFFASGADVTGIANTPSTFQNDGQKKIFWMQRFAVGMELVRAMIDHKKVLITAMNGPGVGAGAAWFQGSSDLLYAVEGTWLQVTFSQMGLVPENGSAVNWAHSMGSHRANDWLLFGGKATVEELKEAGLVNKIFPKENFHAAVHAHLKEMLRERSGKSMMEMKRLSNKATRDARILALYDSMDALAERFVEGEPMVRMKAKMDELAGEYLVHLGSFCCAMLILSQRRERNVRQRCRRCEKTHRYLCDSYNASLHAISAFEYIPGSYTPRVTSEAVSFTCVVELPQVRQDLLSL